MTEIGTATQVGEAVVKVERMGTPFSGPPFLQSGVPRPQTAFSRRMPVPRPER